MGLEGKWEKVTGKRKRGKQKLKLEVDSPDEEKKNKAGTMQKL